MSLFETLGKAKQAVLYAEQDALELKSIDLGVARYRRWRQEADPSRCTPEMRLIGRALNLVVPAVEAARMQVLDKMAGRGMAHWGYPFWTMDADKMAVIALVDMINLADTAEASVGLLCRTIGTHVEQEYQFEQLKREHKGLFDVLRKKIKNWTPRQVQYMRSKASVVDRRWPLRVKYWVGAKLVELVLDNTDLFKRVRYMAHRRGRLRRMVRLSILPEVRTELESHHGDCEVIRPYYLPMVVPPGDWAAGKRGGFRYHAYPLVKPQNILEDPVDHPESGGVVYRAMNLVQRTGWRVNKRVLAVMQQVWQAGGGWAGLPLAAPEPLPEKPPDIDTNEDARLEYKARAREVYDRNARNISKRKSALTKLKVSAAYADQDEFFFPQQLDYRGRMYPVAGDLQPQSDDVARGLLEFSTGKPLGEDGEEWLLIRLANCFGQDKLSFDRRVMWAMDHFDDVVLSAQDPIENRWWASADDPWQALATIFEMGDLLADGVDNVTYVSHLPWNQDGTCNGLQHFAAMLRDPQAAKLVNLIPSIQPADVYELVAALVRSKVAEDAQGIPIDDENPHPSHQWRGRITRKTVKRAAMTLPYGVTMEGMADQFITDRHADGLHKPRSCAVYLRDVTWGILTSELASARQAMDWLKKVASITGKQGHALRWTTPSGFVVVQEALEYKDSMIYTILQRVRIHAANDDGKISAHRQQRCMPPNFVHSMDAAHMMLTVVAAAKRGVTSFNMVHDSFGCHACDAPTMAAVLRDQFVRMYTFDSVLERCREAWQRQTGLALPDPPAVGDFDLSQVYKSEYFFG